MPVPLPSIAAALGYVNFLLIVSSKRGKIAFFWKKKGKNSFDRAPTKPFTMDTRGMTTPIFSSARGKLWK